MTALLDVLTAQPSYGSALRRLICELAIAGRLLPQTSTWAEHRLSAIVSVRGGSTPSMARPEYWGGDVPWVSPKDMHVGDIVTSEMFVTEEALAKTNLELVPLGAVLIVGRSGILKRKLPAQVTRVSCTVNQDIKALTPKSAIESAYLRLWLLGSERAILAEDVKTGTTVQSLVFAKLFARSVKLPPTDEQKRIVAKVDELMALCDRLAAEQVSAAAAHAQLVQALLASLSQARDAADFRASWQQLAEHFHTLFTTEASIDALKQTVLRLGVWGKLVPQCQAEQAATDFLKSVGIKAQEHELPGWASVPLGSLGTVLGGATPSKANPAFWSGDIPWVSPKDMKRALIADAEDHVSTEAVAGSALKLIPPSSILMVVRGMILAHSFPVAFTEKTVTINQDMKALVPPADIARYLLLFLQAAKLDMVALVDRSSHGTCKLISEKLWLFVVAVPPLAEQMRIVAKVDELMALCDQLKLNLTQARQHHEHLASVLVEQAVA